MNDLICIQQLQLWAHVGVHPWEQHQSQSLLADITLQIRPPQQSYQDDLTRTIDYSEAAQCCREIAGATHYRLIETLAEALANSLLNHPLCCQANISLYKPQALAGQAKTAAVTVQRPIATDE